jgi:K+-sensing histidine kinase KdpD
MRNLSEKYVETADAADPAAPEWLGRLAHDLRGPIGPLQMSARMLEDSSSLSTTQVSELAKTIERQTSVLLQLAEELDDISRISHDIFSLRRTPCDLRMIVDNAVAQASQHAHSIGRTARAVAVLAPTSPVLVDADEARLAQLIAQLVGAVAPGQTTAECWIEWNPTHLQAVVRLRDSERRIYRSDAVNYLSTGQSPIDPGTLSMASVIGHRIAVAHGAVIDTGDEVEGRIGELELRMPLANTRTKNGLTC